MRDRVPDPHFPADHSADFKDGYRRGSRDAMKWLQGIAASSRDPHAKLVLDSANTNMGWAFSRARTKPHRRAAPAIKADTGGEP